MSRLEYSKKNHLCYGDNLPIMEDMPDGVVDLIYLDPPFNSKRNYNAIYSDETGNPLPKQVEAFCDTWQFNYSLQMKLRDFPEILMAKGIDGTRAMFLHRNLVDLRNINGSLQSYLYYMAERLAEMRRIMKPSGTIYLHCDPTASHYLKMIMDCIFGPENFLNEIVWHYGLGGSSKRIYSRKHDIILFYSNGGEYYFDKPQVPATSNRMAGEMKGMPDVWIDIPTINNMAKERMGYPTQKPLALLERIVKASTEEGDFVLDPFCGCATTIEAAHNLDRRWMGIDIAIHAIKRVARVRLRDRLGLENGVDYEIVGVPNDIEGAIDMWKKDDYHFQKWVVEEVGGFVSSTKSDDGGIDGRIWYRETPHADLSCMILEVKGGSQINPNFWRSLGGVFKFENDIKIAGLITMRKISGRQLQNINEFMAKAGSFVVNDFRYPRMQLLSVEEILAGKRFDIPGRITGQDTPQPAIPGITRKKKKS